MQVKFVHVPVAQSAVVLHAPPLALFAQCPAVQTCERQKPLAVHDAPALPMQLGTAVPSGAHAWSGGHVGSPKPTGCATHSPTELQE